MFETLNMFVERLERNKSPRTVKSYEASCRKFIEWVKEKGFNNFNELTQDDYLDYIRELKANSKPATVRTKMIAVNNFVEFMEIKGIIDSKPFFNYKDMEDYLPVVHKKEISTLTSKQIQEMLDAVDGDIYKQALIRFLYDTALRVSEVVNAKWSDIDDVNGTHVLTVFGKGKGGYSKKRNVVITEQTYDYIKKLRKLNFYNEYIFASIRTLQKVTERRIEQIVSDTSRKIGLKDVTTHTFRKTSATSLLENGMPIEYVSKYLGHENITTTVNHYLDTNRSMVDNYNKYYKSF